MPKDFRATQIRTHKLIVSGNNESSGPSLLIYSASDATNFAGDVPTRLLKDHGTGTGGTIAGTDVWIFVSGTQTPAGRSKNELDSLSNRVLFAGDVVVSGTLYAERQVVEVDETIQGFTYVSGSAVIEDAFVANEAGGDNDSRIESNDETHMFFVDASTNRISIGDSTDAPAATLEVTNHASAGAYNVPLVQLNNNDVDQIALDVNALNVDTNVIDVVASALEDGAIMNLYSNSSNANARTLVDIKNDNTSAVGATAVRVINDAVASTSGQTVLIKTTAAETNPLLTLENSNAATDKPPILGLNRSSLNTAADDMSLGSIHFSGVDDGNTTTVYAKIEAIASDVTNNDEGGLIKVSVMAGGTAGSAGLVEALSIGGEDVANGTAAAVVVNEGSGDVDFRVESNNKAAALLVDAGNDKVLILSGGSASSANEASASDVNFYVSGTSTAGTARSATTLFGGDAVISGSLYMGGRIYNEGDNDTYIRPRTDRWQVFAGNSKALDINFTGDKKTSIGELNVDIDFEVISLNKATALYVDAAKDQVLILSGGSAHSTNEANVSDVSFYVSGTVGSQGTAVRGTTLFGGDLVTSGNVQLSSNTSGTKVLILSGGAAVSTDEAAGQDISFYVSGTSGASGGTSGGVALFGGDLAVSGSLNMHGALEVGEYIYHLGDSDTYIRFQPDDINLQAGGVDFIKITEDGDQDQIIFNSGSVDVDFRFSTADETHMLYIDGANNRISIGDSTNLPAATLEVTNHASAGAAGVPLVQLNSNDIDQIGLDINLENTTGVGIDIDASNTSANVIDVQADSLVGGTLMSLKSDSSNNNSRSLVYVKNDNTSATGTTLLYLTNDAVASNGTAVIESTGNETNPLLTLRAQSTATNMPPILSLHSADTSNEQDDMQVGRIQFDGTTSNNQTRAYAAITGLASDVTINDLGGLLKFLVQAGGTAGASSEKLALSVGGEDVANGTPCEVVVNEDSNDINFRVETDGEDEALVVDAGDNAVYINKGKHSTFNTVIYNVNNEVLRTDTQGVVFNDAGHASVDFRVESDSNPYALFVDAGNDRVLIHSGGSQNSTHEASGSDINFYVSGTVGSQGSATKGTSLFGGDLVASGTLYAKSTANIAGALTASTDINIGEYIYHIGDSDTSIQFDTDAIRFNVGGKELLNLNEDESTISINNDNDAISTVIKTDTKLAIAAGTPLGAGKDQVLIMSGGSAHSTNEAAGDDIMLYISGTVGSQGSSVRATSLFGGDLVVSGGLHLGSRIFNEGDTDTYIRPRTDRWQIYAGGFKALDVRADTTPKRIEVNGGKEDIDFQVGSDNNAFAIFVDASTDKVMILSGGAATDVDPSAGQDVSFYVSGAVNSHGGTNKGGTLFTGDTFISGVLRTSLPYIAQAGLSGSLTKLTDGTSYLIAGNGVTIVTGSSGAVTITAAGVDAANGADNRVATFSDSDSLNGEANLTFDGSTFTVTGDSSLNGAVTINETGADKDFRIESSNKENALFIDGGTDQVLILSGGSAHSANEATKGDVNFYVSGTVGSHDGTGAVRGTALFGGDAVISGTLHAVLGISGSITQLTDGSSYLIAGNNTTITSASNGAITIADANEKWTRSGAGRVYLTDTDDKLHIGGTGDPGGKVEINVADSENIDGLFIDFNETGSKTALEIDSESTSGIALKSQGFKAGYFKQDISNGYAGYFTRNINEGGNEPLVNIIDDHTANSQPALQIRQDGTGDILRMRDGSDIIHKFKDGGIVYLGAETAADDVSFHVSGSIGTKDSAVASIANFGGDVNVSGSAYLGIGTNSGAKVLVLSGGSAHSTNEATKSDISFYVSGTVGSRKGTGGGAAVFGGDVYASGALGAEFGLSGSLTQLTDGTSYLIAGSGVTITSGSNGAVTIAAAGGGGSIDGSGATNRIATWSDADTLASDADLTWDGTTLYATSAGTTLNIQGDANLNGNVVINQSGADKDFRVESNNKVNALVVNGGTDQVLVLSGGSAHSANESSAVDVNFYVSGTVGAQNTSTRGVALFGGDLVVSGNMYATKNVELAEYIYHVGDIDTFIRFQDDDINIQAGGVDFIKITEDGSQDLIEFNVGETDVDFIVNNNSDEVLRIDTTGIVFNEDGHADVDFRVESDGEDEALFLDSSANTLYINKGNTAFTTIIENTNAQVINVDANGVVFNEEGNTNNNFRVESNNKSHAVFVDAETDRVLVLSGGSAHSINDASAADVNFYVSGTLGSRGTGTRGTSLFGGDAVVSGTLSVGTGSSGVTSLNVYGNADGKFVALIDNDQSSNGHVLKLQTDGNGSGSRLLEMEDGDGDILFRARADGRFGFGPNGVSSMGAGTFVVGIDGGHTADIAISKRLQHLGDSDTYMDFPANDQLKLVVGNVEMMTVIEDGSQDEVIFNEGGADVDFRVESSGKTHAIFVNGGTEQVLILSGGSAHSTDEASGADVNFYVSGAVGSHDTNNRGTAVFGGDTVVSGGLFLGGRIYNEGDVNTYIRPRTDRWDFYAGGIEFFRLTESTVNEAVINEGGGEIDFRVETNNQAAALFVNGSTDQLLFMSGGAVNDPNVATHGDVLVHFSGSRTEVGGPAGGTTGRNQGLKTNVVFGGDIVTSGTIYAGGELAPNNTAMDLYSHTHTIRTQKIGLCDQQGNAPGVNPAITDVFLGISGTIGGKQMAAGGSGTAGPATVSVFGGDVVMSGSLWVETKRSVAADSQPLGRMNSGELVIHSSDRRIKTDFEDISSALEMVRNLKGTYYSPKPGYGNSGNRYIGFVAQEVEEVVPELTYTNPQSGMMGVRYTDTVALLTEAIKEMAAEIDRLKLIIEEK